MITRQQAAIARFRDVLESPVVLTQVVTHLGLDDLKSMLMISKDGMYKEVLKARLQTYKATTAYLRDQIQDHFRCTTDQQRKQTVVSIYQYLCENQWFLIQNPRYHKVVIDKLYDLSRYAIFKTEARRFLETLPALTTA